MFLTPPDTTGVTQLLDQLNKNLHHEYRGTKDKMFTDFNSLNKEAFMMILGRIWNNWAPKQSIVKAARRVRVTSSSLNVNDMQQDKFIRAVLILLMVFNQVHQLLRGIPLNLLIKGETQLSIGKQNSSVHRN